MFSLDNSLENVKLKLFWLQNECKVSKIIIEVNALWIGFMKVNVMEVMIRVWHVESVIVFVKTIYNFFFVNTLKILNHII